MNCTVPVGVPPGPVTVAVKVTDAPKVEGLGVAFVITVVDAAAPMVKAELGTVGSPTDEALSV